MEFTPDTGAEPGRAVSDVVRGRLAELIADDEWLDRLRPRPDEVEEVPPPVGEPAGGRARRAVAQAVALGREHLAAVVVVLLVGVAWTGYSLFQAHSSPVASAAPVIQVSASAAASPSGGEASGAARLQVHVIGAVREPGVVKLPPTARVSDAIAAAGGLTASADPGELNLAQVLEDGVQLKIGSRRHPGGWIRSGTGADGAGATGSDASGGSGGSSGSSGSVKVSLNSATLAQLDTLPGVGPVTAQKILDWRKAHGRFTAVTELQEVDGIGPKTYADIAAHVRL